jgi:uncharacterized protein (DUF58 family)
VRSLALFKLVFRVSGWLRDHLTRNGIALAILTAFAGALGLNTEANLAHLIFSLGVGFMGMDTVSALWVKWEMPHLSAQRYLPPFMTFGVLSQYRIRLTSGAGQTLPPVLLQEVLAQPWGGDSPSGAPVRKSYAAYLRILRGLRVLEIPPVLVASGRKATVIHVPMKVWPTARGVAGFQSLFAMAPGYLGLVQARVPVKVDAATQVVLPRPLPAHFPPPRGHRLLHAGGISQTNHVGDSEEFRSLRAYRAGDPLRSIHWRSFARTGKPVVREYQQEYFARHALVLDTACGPHQHDALEASVSIAAWIAARPLDSDCLLDLMFVGDRVHRVSMGRSLGGIDTVLRALASVTEGTADSTDALLRSVAESARQLSSVVLIFQNWTAQQQKAVSDLLALGLRPTVLLVGRLMATDADAVAADDPCWAGIVHRIPLPSSPTAQATAT